MQARTASSSQCIMPQSIAGDYGIAEPNQDEVEVPKTITSLFQLPFIATTGALSPNMATIELEWSDFSQGISTSNPALYTTVNPCGITPPLIAASQSFDTYATSADRFSLLNDALTCPNSLTPVTFENLITDVTAVNRIDDNLDLSSHIGTNIVDSTTPVG